MFLLLLGRWVLIVNYIVVLFLHEYTHAYVAYKLGYRLNCIKLVPVGVSLNIDNNNISNSDNIKIAIAGPVLNIIMAISCLAIWWIFPELYFFSYGIFEASWVTAIFNLLPCYPLDGARILCGILPKKINKKYFFYICNSIVSVCFLILFFACNNLSMLVISFFVFYSMFTFDNSPKYDFALYTSKVHDKICSIKNYTVCQDIPLYKLIPYITIGEFCVFYIIDSHGKIIDKIEESSLEGLFKIFVPTTPIKDVVLKKKYSQK